MDSLEIETPVKVKGLNRSTRADDKLLGFEYQFYYFLLELLRMKADDLVGFEVKDDVHIESSNNQLILLQLKHTRQTTAQGLPKNLTTSDTDLWKTLSNWIDFIRKEHIVDRSFIKNTHFIFVTNKLEDNNKFINALDAYKIEKNIKNFKKFIVTYSDGLKSNNPNKDYAKKILKLIPPQKVKTIFSKI